MECSQVCVTEIIVSVLFAKSGTLSCAAAQLDFCMKGTKSLVINQAWSSHSRKSCLQTPRPSSSSKRVVTQSLLVVNRRTISDFQQEINRKITDTYKVPSFLLQHNLPQTALEALHRSPDSRAGIPTYVIHEHLFAAHNNLSLVRNPNNDLELHEVCGIDLIQPRSSCAQMLERTLSLPYEKSAMLFTVTRRYDLVLPEVQNRALDDTFVKVHLAWVWPGVAQKNGPMRDRVDFHSRNMMGVCAGQSKKLSKNHDAKYYGLLRHCVLSDGEERRFVLSLSHDSEITIELQAQLAISMQGSDWSKENSVALLSTAAKNAITFSSEVSPLLALLALMRVVYVDDSLSIFDDLLFSVDLCRITMLRALALVGPYANKTVFNGAATYSGSLSTEIYQPPADAHEALRMLKRLHCLCEENNCSICFSSKLPTFVEVRSEAKIECCCRKNLCGNYPEES
eukprot:IDg8063t1